MKFKFIVREVWFGLLGITTDTDEDYELEDILVYPEDTDVYDIYNTQVDLYLVEHQKAIKDHEEIIVDKHTVISLTLNGISELESTKLEQFLNDKTPTGLGVLVYKENTKILRFKFVKLDEHGQDMGNLEFVTSGKFKIEKLDWNKKDPLLWFKKLFKK